MFNNILNKIDLTGVRYTGVKRVFSAQNYIVNRGQKKSISVNQLIFIIMYPSHLKYFLSIVNDLEDMKMDYTVILLNCDFDVELKDYSDRIIKIKEYYRIHNIFMSSLLQFYHFAKYLIKNERIKAYATLKYYKDYYLIITFLKRLLSSNQINTICMYKGDGLYAQTIGSYVKDNYNSIKIIVMQHGLLASIPQYKNLRIDQFWVWSNFFRERLNRVGIDYLVKAMGDPTTDGWYNEINNKANEYTLNKQDIKLILCPNHGNSHTPLSQVLHSLKLVKQYNEEHSFCSLTIKPHPGDINEIVKNNIGSQLNSGIKILSKELSVSFLGYDIVIINNSSVGMDAAFFGKPVIIIAENKEQIMVEQYVKYGFAEIVFDYVQLVSTVNRIIDNYEEYQINAEKFIDDMYEYQGRSAKKIIKELNSLNNKVATC